MKKYGNGSHLFLKSYSFLFFKAMSFSVSCLALWTLRGSLFF